MDYCIKNSKSVYLKLDNNGTPITCVESAKQLFEFSKAKNILGSLPKTLRRMNFRVEAIPDIVTKPKKFVESNTYKVSDEILEWRNKFKTVDEIKSEANERLDKLSELLHENAQKILDVRHKIELENNKNMYDGYLLYVDLRTLLRDRRAMKDEQLILKDVLHMNFSNFSSEQIEKAIVGLSTRKYEVRIVEEDGEVNDSL